MGRPLGARGSSGTHNGAGPTVTRRPIHPRHRQRVCGDRLAAILTRPSPVPALLRGGWLSTPRSSHGSRLRELAYNSAQGEHERGKGPRLLDSPRATLNATVRPVARTVSRRNGGGRVVQDTCTAIRVETRGLMLPGRATRRAAGSTDMTLGQPRLLEASTCRAQKTAQHANAASRQLICFTMHCLHQLV